MELTEVTIQQQIETAKGVLRGLESQYINREADERRLAALLLAYDRGEFKQWNRDIVRANVQRWKGEREQAAIDMRTLEISIANQRAHLAQLEKRAAEEAAEAGEE